MPVSGTKHNKPDNVGDKVKEIKQRQQNWMRQRASSLERDGSRSASPSAAPKRGKQQTSTNTRHNHTPPSTKVTSSTAFKATSIEKKVTTTAATYNLQDNKQKPQTKPKGFQVWRENRLDKDVVTDDGYDINILQVEHPESDLDYRRGSSPTESVCTNASRQTLSPEMFDSLADQIVNRVKRELNLNHTTNSSVAASGDSRLYSPSSYQNVKEHRSSSVPMDSHHCQNCHQLMIAPDHSPMLVIPCGHSFCKACAQSNGSCLNCHQLVQSLTCNIMLQQIIMEYSRQGPAVFTKEKVHSTSEYTPAKYDDTDKSEEYQSLCVRCEAISMEVDDIEEKMGTFDKNIYQEKEQINNITTAQDRLHVEIQNLQTKVADLERHKEEYSVKIDDWTQKKDLQRNKLKMTRSMLQQLEKEKDKLGRYLNLDD